MKITEQNKESVKAFMRILMYREIPDEEPCMIVSMLKNEEQMDELVEYMRKNPQAMEPEIFEKAREIAEL